jgi:hypothetical protein
VFFLHPRNTLAVTNRKNKVVGENTLGNCFLNVAI